VVAVKPGLSISLPLGTHFQFRCDGKLPLEAVAVPMPPWPDAAEAYPVEGPWEAKPTPGGWSRIVVTVDDLEVFVGRLQAAGVAFRNEILAGPGGRQILCEDPSGNPIELFQPG
jgi:catechol 2,3-dioxygenase-like lactoylglutathione lyase family enzyme